jgi:glycosyltransferase involved in cell wall biosynthesis
LAGTARELTRRLDVPVVCTLSGEDLFLEGLSEPHRSHARTLLQERAADLAGLVAMNGYYADVMAEYLRLPRERIHVIPPGLNLTGHATPSPPRPATAADGSPPRSVTIGYLARICPEKGLHLLVEAFRMLAEDAALPPLRLHAAGYLAPAERPYLDAIRARLAEWGLAERFTYLGELDRAAKIAFLQSLSVLSVPTVYRESKGLFVLEAWANGLPAVLPSHGTFPELMAETGGGLLFEPHQPAALAAGLRRMIRDPDFATQCGRQAQQIAHQRYSAELMAQRTIQWYRTVGGGQSAVGGERRSPLPPGEG